MAQKVVTPFFLELSGGRKQDRMQERAVVVFLQAVYHGTPLQRHLAPIAP